MIIPFEELKHHYFSLSDINVIYQKPTWRFMFSQRRIPNGFLCVQKGECQYSFEQGEFTLSPGSIVYLPFNSRHKITVTSDSIEFYRVDFTLQINGEITLFSDHPIKLSDTTTPECLEALRSLANNFYPENNSVTKTEKLCTILSSLQEHIIDAPKSRLTPAINYIHAHLTEHFDCHKLAELCYLSTAQFYNRFHTEYGMTPLEYRDQLLLQRASTLLKSGEISVTEVADMLGFDNPAYFSRYFKKHFGIAPSKYINTNGS